MRQRQIFHGYPSGYSNDPNVTVTAMPPSTYDPMDHMGGHSSSNPTALAASAAKDSEGDAELFGDLPEAKRRKFILVDDPHRGSRVRVRVMLDQVEMKEIPDSYRKTNSVFPRSYFPMQMQSPTAASGEARFPQDDPHDEDDPSSGRPARGRTLVPVPMLDGSETEVPTPRMGRGKRKKEVRLNDLGYRMSWSQSRVFAGRTIFLQRARRCTRSSGPDRASRLTRREVDAYRNKMRSTMLADGRDASAVAPLFETRVGKRKWLERMRRSKRGATP